MGIWPRLGFFVNYFARIVKGMFLGLNLEINAYDFVYSASDFWMDVFPAFVLKIRYPEITWFAGWYQTAPNPIRGFSEAKRENSYKLNALLYWLSQLIVKPLIKWKADCVLINNEFEKKVFPNFAKKDKTIVVLGAVDVDRINSYKKNNRFIKKKYDVVFQGRFHAQKGVVELIDIWKIVVKKKPEAKLAMIGDGPLMEDVKLRISKHKLQGSVKLFGYVFDGPKKYKIFSQSKIVVHPALYDSGGMAAAEAMAFGLPCVGFKLQSYENYYPQGMVKVPVGDLDIFATTVFDLLSNEKERRKIGKEALQMIRKNWSWEIRAQEVIEKINKV